MRTASRTKTAERGLTPTVVVAVAMLSGCGSSGGSGQSATTPSASPSAPSSSTAGQPSPSQNSSPAQQVMITIKDFGYQMPASVSPGATVSVRNEDAANHTVTSKSGGFDSLVKGNGTSTFKAPTKAGSYPIICIFHGQMSGTLVVR